jgi:hypothetical protein
MSALNREYDLFAALRYLLTVFVSCSNVRHVSLERQV